MNVNKFKPHVLLIPEDDADRQLANGFLNHDSVDDRRLSIRGPAGGWSEVLHVFQEEYVPRLRESDCAHVVMLIDFDDQVEERRAHFDRGVPDEFKSRVFVVGSKYTPEQLRSDLRIPFEAIGKKLADDCDGGGSGLWNHPHLVHNDPDVKRLVEVVKPILFAR